MLLWPLLAFFNLSLALFHYDYFTTCAFMASAYKWKFQTKNRPEMSLIYEVYPHLCRQLSLIPMKMG